eukprot:12108543-Prorocentrum_lima.AAC.1
MGWSSGAAVVISSFPQGCPLSKVEKQANHQRKLCHQGVVVSELVQLSFPKGPYQGTVSYTHLTLPTICSV